MKKAKYIIITILLGAFGSAFWEICLKKIFLLIHDLTIPFLLLYFNDSFYARVARSLNDTSYETFIIIMLSIMSLIFVPPSFLAKLLYSYPTEKRNRILQNVTRLTCFFILTYNYFIVAFASTTARDTLNNIEIVAPYITDTEYKQLRSDFFQMDSKSDYESIVKELTSIAEKHNLQLK